MLIILTISSNKDDCINKGIARPNVTIEKALYKFWAESRILLMEHK